MTNDQIKQVLKKIAWVPVEFLYLQYMINPYFIYLLKFYLLLINFRTPAVLVHSALNR